MKRLSVWFPDREARMLKKIIEVARREYLETVKTKAFIIGVIVLPLLMGVMIVFGGKMQKKAFAGDVGDRNLAIVNFEKSIDQELRESFEDYNKKNPGRKILPHFVELSEDDAKQVVRKGEYDALMYVESGVVDGEAQARLFSRPSSDATMHPTLQRILNSSISTVRYLNNGLDPELIRELGRWVSLKDIYLSEEGESKGNRIASMMLPFFFMMLIYFGVTIGSQGLLSSVIEEKGNRVIEVLLSAISPLEMMFGKIVGQSAIGLTLMALYIGGAIAATILGGYGEVLQEIQSMELVLFLMYYIMGFLLFNSIFAAIGSAFNTIKETQSIMAPVMIILILPMMFWTNLVQQPESTLAVTLSLIPPISPMVMVMRISAMPQIPWLQVIASLVILFAAVVGVVWAAARIFRTGILMYGKAPSVVEILRWVKES